MAGRNYWLDLFTPVTWQEFLDAGGKVSGFRESRWNTLQKVKPGDYFPLLSDRRLAMGWLARSHVGGVP